MCAPASDSQPIMQAAVAGLHSWVNNKCAHLCVHMRVCIGLIVRQHSKTQGKAKTFTQSEGCCWWCPGCPGCLLDELERVRAHAVWGKALASVGLNGWCSDPKLLAECHEHLMRVAAESVLDESRVQQLKKVFFTPAYYQASQVSSLDMPVHHVFEACFVLLRHVYMMCRAGHNSTACGLDTTAGNAVCKM